MLPTDTKARRCASARGGKLYVAHVAEGATVALRQHVAQQQLQLLVTRGADEPNALTHGSVQFRIGLRRFLLVHDISQEQSGGAKRGVYVDTRSCESQQRTAVGDKSGNGVGHFQR